MGIARSLAAISAAVAVLAGIAALLVLPGSPAVEPIGACSLACGGPDDPCPHPVRVEARRVGDRIEVAIREGQDIGDDCSTIWTERWLPPRRFAPAPGLVDVWLIDRWLNSTPLVTIGSEVRVSLRIRGDREVSYALQQRVFGEWGERRLLAPFLPADAADGEWRESEVLDFIPAYKPVYPDQPAFTLERDRQYFATLVMEDGAEIEIELFADDAPVTVNWFVFLAREGYYDGLRFDRVLRGEIAYAAGVFNYRHLVIPLEFTGRANAAGAVGMVPTGNPEDANGEFYIKLSDEGSFAAAPAQHLERLFFEDPQFVFGRVVRGLDAARAFPTVDRREHEVGPLIREIRISSEPRDIPRVEPGVVPYGFRAGARFERNVIGDPDAAVLIRRFSPSRGCYGCLYSLSPVDLHIFEALIATGIARYEVIPTREAGGAETDHALSCAADQGRFWEMIDQISTRAGSVPFGSSASRSFTINDYAGALGMDVGEFRSCVGTRRNAAEVLGWYREAAAAGVAGWETAWFVDGVRVEAEDWRGQSEAIIKAARAALE